MAAIELTAGPPTDVERARAMPRPLASGATASSGIPDIGMTSRQRPIGSGSPQASDHHRHLLRPVHRRYWGQLRALVGKNTLLMKRQWITTAVQVLAPVLFVVLIYVIDTVLASSGGGERSPAAFATFSDSESNTNLPQCRVFDRAGGRYGFGNPIPGAWCNAVLFAPSSNKEASAVMQLLARRRGFTYAADADPATAYPDVDVLGFPTEAGMRQHLLNFTGRAGVAVLFNASTAQDVTLPADVRYEVWFNDTVSGRWLSRVGLDHAYESHRLSTLGVRVQRAIDSALVAVRGGPGKGSAGITVNLRKYVSHYRRLHHLIYRPLRPPTRNFNLRYPELTGASTGSIVAFLPLFFYCAFMLNFIIALNRMVAEKESGMLGGMRAMGLLEGVYWTAHILEYLVLTIVSTLLVYVAGVATALPLFTNTNFFVIIFAFSLYSMSMIAVAFALASIINRTRVAGMIGFMAFIVGMIVQVLGLTGFGYLIYDTHIFSQHAINGMMSYPPLDFSKIIADIDSVTRPTTSWNYETQTQIEIPGGTYTWDNLFNGTYSHELRQSLTGSGTYRVPPTIETFEWLAVITCIFLFLAWYLGQLFPGDNGRSQPPWFIGLKKTFGMFSKFTAVDGVSLEMKRGQVFALLGHNGAGKTTAIKMITGHLRPTAGNAHICGHSVNHRVSTVRQLLGVCPQHDLLWPQLTPREHLRCFALMKGISAKYIPGQTQKLLDSVRLWDVRDKPAGTFSGGMKRRLSVAIAMIGNPACVVLDEPTTGMDPMNRRYVWEMIQKLKRDRVVLLTTHSMEEADALADNMAIMKAGEVVAQGTSLALKAQFGDGYTVKLLVDSHNVQTLKAEVAARMPSSRLTDDAAGALSYSVGVRHVREIPPFFQWLEQQEHLSATTGAPRLFKDWGLSYTTMEEVFIKLVRGPAGSHNASARRFSFRSNRSLVPLDSEAGVEGSTAPQPAGNPNAGTLLAGAGGGEGEAGARPAEPASAVKGVKLPAPAPGTVVGSASALAAAPASWVQQLAAHARGAKVSSWRQFRGLVRKSATWQFRQTKTLVCQLVCPVILLLLILTVQLLVVDPLNDELALRGDEQRLEMFAKCEECKAQSTDDCFAHRNRFSWCSDSWNQANPQCQPGYCTTGEFNATSAQDCWNCREYEEQYGGAIVDEAIEWATPAVRPASQLANRVGVEVSPGVTEHLNMYSADWVSRVLFSRAADVPSVGSFNGGMLVANTTTCCLYNWNDGWQTVNRWSQGLYDQLVDAAAGNRSGILANFPLRQFQRGNNDWENNGPFTGETVWAQTLGQFNFRIEQQRTGDFSSHYQPPGGNRYNYLFGPKFVDGGTPAQVDELIWNNQEEVKRGGEAVLPKLDPAVYQRVDELFPTMAVSFNKLDAATGSLDITLQSTYTWTSLSSSTYRYMVLQREGKPDWCSDSSNGDDIPDECEVDITEVRPDWQTWAEGEMTPANKLLSGLSTMWLRHVAGPHMSVVAGFKPMPKARNNDQFFDPEVILNGLLNLLVPLATVFLVPTFIMKIVMEKQLKLRAMMLSMGLKLPLYWTTSLLFDVGVQMLLMSAFWGLGMVLQIRAVLFVGVFGAWSLASVTFAYFMSTLFNRTKPAVIVSYLLLIVTVIFSIVYNQVMLAPGTAMPEFLLAYPPMAYFRALYLLTQRSFDISDVNTDEEIVRVILWLLGDFGAFMVLTGYLDNVLPKTYGVRRSPLFCVSCVLYPCRRRMREYKVEAPKDMRLLDSDVAQQIRDLVDGRFDQDAPVQIMNLRKSFGRKQAVNDVNLVIGNNTCFGLLGPNGAGKTTVISILTGLIPTTSGTAKVAGLDIRYDMGLIHRHIGICPQFDVHFASLTVKEHLLLYARLKGVAPSKEMAMVDAAIDGIGLAGWGDTASSKLSGGMRRRLSIAMALCGSPRVLFLDEPSTGLDVETRRGIWRVIKEARAGRSIILTTHSLGIMANGSLRCLGTPFYLKQKFGEGFKLHVTFEPSCKPNVMLYVRQLAPAAQVLHDFAGSLTFQIPRGQLLVSETFHRMENRPAELCIHDWGLQQTSLEEVFLRIAHEAEHEVDGTAP